MDFIDVKYINLISSRLHGFKQVKKDLYNFRCPICGDSQKRKNKARGYIFSIKNNCVYKCHNCGTSVSFNNFLKSIDSVTHKHYSLEKFKEGKTGKKRAQLDGNSYIKTCLIEFNKPLRMTLCCHFQTSTSHSKYILTPAATSSAT